MDKKLLIILLLTVIYIFGIHPFGSQSEFKRIELKNIHKSIAEERFIAKKAEEIKGVKAASPFLMGQVMLSRNQRSQGVFIRGILPKYEKEPLRSINICIWEILMTLPKTAALPAS